VARSREWSIQVTSERLAYVASGDWSATETLQSRVNDTAVMTPERTAAVDAGNRRLSYGKLDADADALARSLVDIGAAPGQVVGMQVQNRVEALIVMCGIERAGAVVAPLMPMYREKELQYISRVANMRTLIVPGRFRNFDYVDMAQRLRASAFIDEVIAVEQGGTSADALSLESLIKSGYSSQADLPELHADSDAALMFTSGTTGSPKGVLHNHNTMLSGNRILSRTLGLDSDDVIYVPAVVGHGTGYIWGLRFALFLGTRAVLLDRWEPERGARLLEQEQCTWTMVAPTFVQDLLDAAQRADIDLKSLRYLSCGGAAPASSLRSAVRERLGIELLRLYGQTEAFLSTHCLPDDPDEKLDLTEGRPLPSVELRVVSDNGTDAEPGELGELYVRGPHKCVGLLTDQGQRRIDADDWIASGDRAVLDANGYLSIRGRIKELINRGGFKYSPVEVEDVLHTHPSIARVAVVPTPDGRLGERGCACVVLRPGTSITLESIVDFLRAAGMAPFKWPEQLRIFDTFPMTPSGKIQKHIIQLSLKSENLSSR
jgi:acyl-CoA synthetase (AMP-forming)/AMP-acid ligase II